MSIFPYYASITTKAWWTSFLIMFIRLVSRWMRFLVPLWNNAATSYGRTLFLCCTWFECNSLYTRLELFLISGGASCNALANVWDLVLAAGVSEGRGGVSRCPLPSLCFHLTACFLLGYA